jgi:hypothetical protein
VLDLFLGQGPEDLLSGLVGARPDGLFVDLDDPLLVLDGRLDGFGDVQVLSPLSLPTPGMIEESRRLVNFGPDWVIMTFPTSLQERRS